MSMDKKLADARDEGVIHERARVFWIIDSMVADLKQKLSTKIMSDAERHLSSVRLRLTEGIARELRLRIVSNVQAPT